MIIRSRSLRGLFLRKLPITTSRGHHKITGLNIAYDLFCHRISFDRVPQSHGDYIQLINRCTAMTYFNIGVRTTSVSDAVQEVSMMTSGMSKTYLKYSLRSLRFSLSRVPFSSMSSSHSGLDVYNVLSWIFSQNSSTNQLHTDCIGVFDYKFLILNFGDNIFAT